MKLAIAGLLILSNIVLAEECSTDGNELYNIVYNSISVKVSDRSNRIDMKSLGSQYRKFCSTVNYGGKDIKSSDIFTMVVKDLNSQLKK